MESLADLQKKLNFDKVDLTPPDVVLRETGEQLKEITRGLVKCEVLPYTGPISSYTHTRTVGPSALLDVFQPRTVEEEVDIQSKLGEIGNTTKKFEVCLETPNDKQYKFRLMFIKYNSTIYPVTVVLESDIANELPQYGNKYIYNIKSRNDFQRFVTNVINTDRVVNILQQLINLAGNIELPEVPEEEPVTNADIG